MKHSILITGSTGYIGKHLREYFHTSYRIFSPTHTELDLQNTKEVERFFKTHAIHTVIHAAVVGGGRKENEVTQNLEINLRILMNILRCKLHFQKFIHLGSGAEYDKSRPLVQIKETDFGSCIPRDIYGFYKYIAAKHLETTAGAVNLRIFGLFGSGENYHFRFISNAICRNLYGMPITIKKNVYFDYMYIKDFVRIVEYFVNHTGKYACYNIGTGKTVDLITIAKKINGIAATPSRIIIREKGLKNAYSGNIRRLIRELKHFQFTEFDTSLRELYQWYKKRKLTIDPNDL